MNVEPVPIRSCTVNMIRIKCPYCGERDHSESTYGGDASIKYPALNAPKEDWIKAIFLVRIIEVFKKKHGIILMDVGCG